MAFVYVIHNLVNGKMYVGKTSQSLPNRWKGHLRDCNDGRYLGNAILKYGADAFVMEQLCEVDSDKEALDLERLWILTLGTYQQHVGYNLTFGGEENYPTERVKALYSLSMVGRWATQDFRSLMKEKRTGLRHTPEARKRISEAIKEHHKDPEFSRRRFSPSARAKISAANQRRKVNEPSRTSPTEVVCGICQLTKPRDSFTAHAGTYTGVASSCKQCRNKQDRVRKAARKEKQAFQEPA